MTIKELCTKVREAAESATGGPWVAGATEGRKDCAHVWRGAIPKSSDKGEWIATSFEGGPVTTSLRDAHYIATVNPSVALALLGRIDELEKALGDLLAANDGVQNELCNGPEVPDFDPMALGRAQLRVDEAERVARRLLPGDTR